MSKYIQGKGKEEQGSSLISTLLLLLFLTLLMTASAAVIKHQIIQYKQTAHSYEAKALIEMTEALISVEDGGHYPSSVLFNNGKTVVLKTSETQLLIKATLNSRYTSQKHIEIPVKSVIPAESDQNHGVNKEDPRVIDEDSLND
ncbi:MAG: hypothetical protein JJU16_04000 [Alkalibacterium sp.]|nr:hypothetical protein [Alkalibacterium sp.]